MTFPEFLRAEVLRLGNGKAQYGEQIAAIVWGTSPRTIRRIAAGEAVANKAEQAGARILLPQAPTVSEFGRRKPKAKPIPA